ncbi:MAG: hypothetical protein QGH59_04685, partial [Gemmatimonadota bacterium]|nr:hypothetical protein [Gemmatimonadota bacterium]
RKSRNRLLALGLTEVLTPALVDGDQEESAIGNPGDLLGRPVPVRNPISSDRGHLRGSLVPSLLRVLASNQAHSLRDLAVFEVGRVFRLTAAGEIVESLHAGLLLSGQGLAGTVARSGKWCDFFDLKGILEVYLEAFGTVAVESGAAPGGFFHADRSALVSVDGQGVGAIGEAGAEARRVFDIPPDAPVFVAEVDVDRVGCARQEIAEFRALPRYPGVERDLAVVVSAACRHAQVEEVIRSAAGELLVGVSLFDVYEGEQIGADLKSLAYNLRFCSLERSLTNDEVDARVERITKRLSEDLDARIRQD